MGFQSRHVATAIVFTATAESSTDHAYSVQGSAAGTGPFK